MSHAPHEVDVGKGAPAALRADVARHYDQLDRFYREIWGEHVHHGLWISGRESPEEAVEALVRRVAERARIEPGARVCDAGSGYGGAARLLVRELDAEVTAVTLSPEQHRHALAAGLARDPEQPPNPRHLLGDWLQIDLPERHFDAVVAIESSEHMADPRAAFRKAHRVLRPGGRLVVCAWLAAKTPSGWQRQYLLEPIREEGRLAWLPDRARLEEAIAAAGLRIESTEDITRQVRRTWSICLRRAAAALLRRPEYRRFLLDPRQRERVFARTLVRIWVAYRTGAMRYAVVSARRPSVDAPV